MVWDAELCVVRKVCNHAWSCKASWLSLGMRWSRLLMVGLCRLSDHLVAALNMQQGRIERAALPCDIPTKDLISTKLASKLAQQLKVLP